MGTAAATLKTIAVAVAAMTTSARADTCTGITAGGDRFPTCFDVGNRVVVTGGTDGLAAGIQIRHEIHFDDEPDLVWKLEHGLAQASYGGLGQRYAASIYEGRFLRHSHDGHIVLPFGTPLKIFLPFDVGVEAQAGQLDGKIGSPTATLGVMRAVALFDLSRSDDFRRRLAIGPAVRWDANLSRQPEIAVTEHVVAPFSLAALSAHLESTSGITVADLRVEGGSAWHGDGSGWRRVFRGQAEIERTVLAINDRPLALVLGARYDSDTDELLGQIGARFALFQHRDARVSLTHTASR